MDDRHYVFNYTRNRDKLFANLVSIIDGIMSDGEITDSEVLYLDTWLLEANEIISNGVIRSLSERVGGILADRTVTPEEKLELKDYLSKIQRDILDIPEIDFYSTESDLHLLNGLCKGLIADRHLNEYEIRYLDWWLTQNGALKSNYPGKELYSLVKSILSDEVITREESEILHKALMSFTGCDLDSGVVDGMATRLPVDELESVNIGGKKFCLTGVFTAGKRSVVEERIISAEGLVADAVTKSLDYLVIGTLSSRDWRFSSHGRKIEKAVSYRDEKGWPLKIISEEMLFSSLSKLVE